ncbi:LysR family transcriptional regulator [Novosphingobium sp. FGD1]|uniref:LysR family transcriptional regulator n=1 Tax=Novosphingobium silvae TaxID=2692619 RepID=A0A7X4GDV1_9SPHN|nr:LysR family transcriptional regulator [Novosphingobium silvae]
MTFDMRQLRYAIAAADHGSFYRAARALDVEQSTFCRNILRLERMIGAKLFDRSRAGVTTTIAGTRFIRSARPMVANADRMVAATRDAGQGRAGALMLGHNSSVSAGNLRATVLAWQSDNPDVDFGSVETDRGALLAGLDTGEIDIAILMGDAGHEGYRREPFWSERIVVALPAQHPLAGHEIVHWTDLRSERFVLPAADPGSDIRDMLLGRLSMSGAHPDIRIDQTTRETVLSLLGAGRRMSIVCEGSTGVRYPDVVYRPIHGEQGPALTVYSGCWREDNGNPALRRFLGFIKARYALSFDFSQRSE